MMGVSGAPPRCRAWRACLSGAPGVSGGRVARGGREHERRWPMPGVGRATPGARVVPGPRAGRVSSAGSGAHRSRTAPDGNAEAACGPCRRGRRALAPARSRRHPRLSRPTQPRRRRREAPTRRVGGWRRHDVIVIRGGSSLRRRRDRDGVGQRVGARRNFCNLFTRISGSPRPTSRVPGQRRSRRACPRASRGSARCFAVESCSRSGARYGTLTSPPPSRQEIEAG